MKFWIKMLAGLVMGIIVGSYIEPVSLFLEPLRITGTLFFRLLGFFVFPLLFFSVVRCIIYLRSKRRLFIVMVKSLGYFILLTVIGATVGVVLGDVLLPGIGMNVQEFESPLLIEYPETSGFILGVIPGSVLEFITSGYGVLAIIFVSFLLAIGIILAKEDSDSFHSLIISIVNTLHKLNLIILEFLPIGIFAHVGYTMGYMTADMIMPYLKLILIIIAGSFIQIFIIQALFVFAFTKLIPFKFIHGVMPAAMIGYVSGSRYAAYPVRWKRWSII